MPQKSRTYSQEQGTTCMEQNIPKWHFSGSEPRKTNSSAFAQSQALLFSEEFPDHPKTPETTSSKTYLWSAQRPHVLSSTISHLYFAWHLCSGAERQELGLWGSVPIYLMAFGFTVLLSVSLHSIETQQNDKWEYPLFFILPNIKIRRIFLCRWGLKGLGSRWDKRPTGSELTLTLSFLCH